MALNLNHFDGNCRRVSPSAECRQLCQEHVVQSLTIASRTPVSFTTNTSPIFPFAAATSPFEPCGVRPRSFGKLRTAALGGGAALTTTAVNPLSVPTKRNIIDVKVDGVPVQALVDTGAHISVMSASLRRRLKKVLTPAAAQVLRVADGGVLVVLGMCTVRLSIAGRPTSVLLAVIDNCPHDVILGLDFLSNHYALIDCATGILQLELPQLAG